MRQIVQLRPTKEYTMHSPTHDHAAPHSSKTSGNHFLILGKSLGFSRQFFNTTRSYRKRDNDSSTITLDRHARTGILFAGSHQSGNVLHEKRKRILVRHSRREKIYHD